VTPSLQRLFVVRHGETAWSVTRQHTGRTDLPLTAQGESDAEALAPWLAQFRFAAVLSSPLQRARRTAVLAGFGASLQPDPDLLEWDYGAYEGRRTVDIRREYPGWRLFEHGCPGGETPQNVSARADRAIGRIRRIAGDVLVFAHQDILRVIAVRWLGLDVSQGRFFPLSTASVGILGYDHGIDEPAFRLWNAETRHSLSRSAGGGGIH
jgi:probable phosphoglycerate mutase